MHDAPSVSYPVGRSFMAGALLLSLWALGALACIGLAGQGASPWRLAVVIAACLGAGAWAAAWWHRLPAGLLAWDGGNWTWSGGGALVEAGSVQVTLDLQRALLLRWKSASVTRWFWIERGWLPARWDAMRRAVYSRANPQAPSRAEPPSATP